MAQREVINVVKLTERGYMGEVRAMFPDGKQRTYQNRRTASRAVEQWNLKQWRELGHKLGWENVPEVTTNFEWSTI